MLDLETVRVDAGAGMPSKWGANRQPSTARSELARIGNGS
jgi:hypothetical protein